MMFENRFFQRMSFKIGFNASQFRLMLRGRHHFTKVTCKTIYIFSLSIFGPHHIFEVDYRSRIVLQPSQLSSFIYIVSACSCLQAHPYTVSSFRSTFPSSCFSSPFSLTAADSCFDSPFIAAFSISDGRGMRPDCVRRRAFSAIFCFSSSLMPYQ